MLQQWCQTLAGPVRHRIDGAAGWVMPDGPLGYASIVAGVVRSTPNAEAWALRGPW